MFQRLTPNADTHSCRNASIGSRSAARLAGYRPKMPPIRPEMPKESTSELKVIIVFLHFIGPLYRAILSIKWEIKWGDKGRTYQGLANAPDAACGSKIQL